MNTLKDQTVLVLGLGISGLAMARWCVRCGAQVTVADTRATPPQLAALRAECSGVRFRSGPLDEALLAEAPWTVIARSPGLSPQELAPLRDWAHAHGAAWVGELDLFSQALRDLSQREHLPYHPQVLAITGTNGKTTVTALTGLLLQRAGVRTAVAGNIGPALLDVLAQALDAETQAEKTTARLEAEQAPDSFSAVVEAGANEPSAAMPVVSAEAAPSPDAGDEDLDTDEGSGDEAEMPMLVPSPPAPALPPHLPAVWVLEVSSFQLDGVAGGAWDSVPTAATLLNISEDHLDWHGNLDAYTRAKAAVFGAQALMLLNRDDERVMALKPAMNTVKVGGRNRQQPARPWASFGLNAPTEVGDWGIESVGGMDWLVRALALDETRKRGRAAQEAEEIYFQRLMPVDALRIRGRHNAANALAALALASSTGAALGAMLHGLREYRGEPNRVEPVGIIDGVEYFNDSKGTNVGATLAAVSGLGAERRLVVILGGDGKGQNFQPLAEPLARHARAVVLIGRDAHLIRSAVADSLDPVPMLDAQTLPEAVRLAQQQAQPGDAVLMSPACASLDMFDNYAHRAWVFVEAVRALADERGVALEGSA
ncbi:UDP-N-acetylmuramoyl-L-alanine--D-glutamate ligase [Hydrogenophaga sp.]|uniref:UDP-N-acetylmuramoyl-L-alanine--D-glutamate ligase n=1 Tax=Hydrogenophaga sp. TaxID=1904254 RepID=UPI0026230811|nr:UDP-N-acetylmuramoyl-L-alanine--D-glutamate ligase [Hydrogenophaga sp.]MDM7950776.1 UDP-N-acetylmuramoyl-L-alanine--D-glutamate ligase [Hydrogenophaga sp.]